MKHLKCSGKLLEQFKDHQYIYHLIVTWLRSSCVCFPWDSVQVYAYTHSHNTQLHIHVHMHTHIPSVHTYMDMYTTHRCRHIDTCMHMHLYICVVHTYICIYAHIYTHTHLSIYTHQYVLIYMYTSPELNSLKVRSSWISPLNTSGTSLRNKDVLLHTFKVFIIPKKINSKALISYYI